MRRILAIAACLAAASALAVPAQAGVADLHIAIENFSYSPDPVTRPASATTFQISFDNGGTFPHTATSNSFVFDTGQIAPDNSVPVGIYGAGTYPYHCENHADMRGTFKMRPTASDASIDAGQEVTIRAGADFLKGVAFDVQRRRNDGNWISVRDDTFDATPTFTLNNAGTYEFRVRTVFPFSKGAPHSQWSPVRKVVVS